MSLAEDMFKNNQIFCNTIDVSKLIGGFTLKLEDGSAVQITGFNLTIRTLTAEEAQTFQVPEELKPKGD